MVRSMLCKVPFFWSILIKSCLLKYAHVCYGTPLNSPNGIVAHSNIGSSVPRSGFRGLVSYRSGHDRQEWASMKCSHHIVAVGWKPFED